MRQKWVLLGRGVVHWNQHDEDYSYLMMTAPDLALGDYVTFCQNYVVLLLPVVFVTVFIALLLFLLFLYCAKYGQYVASKLLNKINKMFNVHVTYYDGP